MRIREKQKAEKLQVAEEDKVKFRFLTEKGIFAKFKAKGKDY